MSSFLKDYDNVADAKITAALVIRIKVRDFERLKEILKAEFSDAYIVKMKTGLGKLWIKEGEEK